MWKRTVTAHLDPLPACFQIRRVARTVRPGIQRAVAEQTVAFLKALVAGKILTVSVFKKAARMLHNIYPSFFFLYLPTFSTNSSAKTGFDG